MSDNVKITESGNIELPLPIKVDNPLPNNRAAVLRRTKSTLHNMKRNSEKFESCLESMGRNIFQGFVKAVPTGELAVNNGSAWWLPIFAVQHKQKLKYRLVFDASAKYHGTSLNCNLMSGPDLNNQLRAVLLRFRERHVAFIADIEGMFNAFRVPYEQTNFLRFFWYKENDPTKELVEYKAMYHIFGARSSPAVATFALQLTTRQPEAVNYPLATPFLLQCFYVDDGMFSVNTIEEAVGTLTQSRKLLSNFNIRLHKIASNSAEVLSAFPCAERAETVQSLNFNEPSTRTLGLMWNNIEDTFIIDARVPNKEFTKRGVLSTINSLYDPLGFVSPVTLHGRLIQRKLVAPAKDAAASKIKGLGWDEPLPQENLQEWNDWKKSLVSLAEVRIPRSFLIPHTERASQELHVYCDASEVAISFVIYTKTTDKSGNNHIAFVLGNSRLAPKAAVSLPRLELCAAVEASQALSWTVTELRDKPDNVHLYSDSLVTLGYINNETRRFSKYVSRRVEIILKHTKPSQWHYVESKMNPADVGSRPLAAGSLLSTLWFTGPPSLKDASDYSCAVPIANDLPEQIHEVSALTSRSVDLDDSVMSTLIKRAKSWHTLVKTTIIIQKLFYHLDRARQRLGRSIAVRNPEISEATAADICIADCQKQVFESELKVLARGEELAGGNKIIDLTPFIDNFGILRVGGRISRARLPFSSKHPVLLPRNHPLSTVILKHHHSRVGHQGRLLTHGAIRESGFHILEGRQMIRKFISECVLCQKLRGPRMIQRMADLPEQRLDQVPAFTHIGLDVFGAYYVYDGLRTRYKNSQIKVWVVIFCCMVSRAVHCEMIHKMDTTSFIHAMRRFAALRGACKSIYSDNGSNIVGAKRELSEVNFVEVERNLQWPDCKWHLNPPCASHFGGHYERKIGSIRRVLENTITLAGPKGLSSVEMQTLLAEASNIVNHTPLYEVSNSPDDPAPLSPHMLLTLRENSTPCDLDCFTEKDLLSYGTRRWRRVQYLAGQFWQRWRSEILLDLNKRHKWRKKKPCARVGDLVLVSEKNSPRNHWPCGRIVLVNRSEDGLVRSVQIKLFRGGELKVITRAITDCIMLVPNKDHEC